MANMNGLGINISVNIEDSKSIETKLNTVLQKVNSTIKISNIEFDEKAISEKFNGLLKSASALGTEFKQSFSSIPLGELQQALNIVNQIQQKQMNSRMMPSTNNNASGVVSGNAIQSTNGLDELIKKYEDLGYKVSVIGKKGFVDEKQLGKLKEFTIELDKQNGIIEKMTYNRGIAGSNGEIVPFNLSSLKSIDNTDKLIQQYEKEVRQLEETEAKANKQKIAQEQSYQKEIEKTISLITKKVDALDKNNILPKENVSNLRNQISGLSMNSDESQFAEVNKLILEQVSLEERLAIAIKNAQENTKNFTKEQQARNKAMFDGILNAQKAEQAQQSMENAANEYVQKTSIALDNLRTKYGSSIPTKELADLKIKLESIKNLNVGGKPIESMEKLKKAINETKIEYAQLDSITRQNASGFFSTISSNIGKFLQFYVGAGGIISVINEIKQGVSLINDLNKSQTNIQMITGMNSSSVQQLTKDYSSLAGQLHETTSQIMEASQEFLRAGHNQEETAKLLQSSTIMSKIAGQGQKESADQLIAITNGFKISADETMSVVDKLVMVDNSSATSTKELGEAIERTASSAQMAGVTFEQLVSYIGTVSSVTRKSATSIGESFKTIFARYQDVRGGKNFDIEGDEISNVERDFRKYADIEIRDSVGTFKDFSIVLGELDKKWKTLSQTEQSGIAKALAGTRQRENFLVLMNNMNTALDLQTKETDSNGNAMQRYGEYAKSTEAKLNDLKNAGEQAWLKILNSSEINITISALTKLVQTFGNLSTFVGTASAALLIFKGQAILGAIQGITAFTANLIGACAGESAMTVATVGLSSALNALTATPFGALVAILGATTIAFNLLTNSAEETKEVMDQVNTTLNETKNTDNLISKYETLKQKIDEDTKAGKDNKEAKQQLLDIEKQFAQTFKGNIDGFTAEGDAIIKNLDAVKKLNDEKKKQAIIDATLEYNKVKSKYDPNSSLSSDLLGSSYMDQYLQNKKKRDEAMANGDDDRAITLNKQMQKTREEITRINELAVQLQTLGVKDVKVIDMETGAWKQLTPEVENNTNITKENANAKQNSADSSEVLAKAQQQASDSFEDATNKIDFYNKALSELDKDGVLNASTVKEIFKNHQELVGSLKDEATLRDKLTTLIGQQETAQETAYKNMLANSTDFYNENIRGNTEMQNKINATLSTLVDSQGKAYSIDLNNFSTVSEAKLSITKQIVKSIAGAWADFWDSTANDFSTEFYDDEMGDRVSGTLVSNRFNQASSMGDKIRAKLSEIDKIVFDPVKLNFSSINNKQPVKDNSADKAKDAAEKAMQEAYNTIESVEDKIREMIQKQVEQEQKALDDRLKNYEDFINKKLKILDEEYDKEDYKDKLAEENKKKAELQKQKADLAMDSSLEAKMKREELDKQIADQQKVIDDMEKNKNREQQKKNLQDQLDAETQKINKQKEALDTKYSNQNIDKMAKDAALSGKLTDTKGKVIDLKTAYIDFENKFGDGMTALGQKIKDEFITKLTQAKQLISSMSNGKVSQSLANSLFPQETSSGGSSSGSSSSGSSSSGGSSSGSGNEGNAQGEQLLAIAKKYLGIP